MTQHYLCGELSMRLEHAVAALPAAEVARLRQQAESTVPAALGSIVIRVLHLCDDACWDALCSGDVDAFADVAAFSAELLEFAVCAQLLDEA